MGMSNAQNRPVRVEREGLPEMDIQWFAEEVDEGSGAEDADTAIDDGGQGGSGDVTESDLAGWTSIFPKEQLEAYKDLLSGSNKPRDFLEKVAGISEKAKAAIIPPGEDATDEERSAYLKALGVPDSGEGYEFKAIPKELESQLGDIKSFNEWFRETAHSLDMTKAQAEMFYSKYLESVGERTATQKEAREKLSAERTAAIKKAWGDNADGNFELAKRAVQTFADEEFNSFLSETGLAEDPRMISMFYNVAQKIGGDTFELGSLSGEPENKGGLHYTSIRRRFGVSQE